jgi:choline dehydrogenase
MSHTTIVVGSGSSGGVIASRLSEEPTERVILFEAGPDYPTANDLPEHLRDPFNPQIFGHDWEFEGFFVEPPEERPLTPYPRGRLVGGSSAVNGIIAQRGTPEDFEAWAAAGIPGWDWEHVLPSYLRIENDLEYGASDIHNDSGPVPIVRLGREEWPRVVSAFEQACIERGYPVCEDHNAPDSTGIGRIPRNQLGNYRASTLLTYLSEARKRPNLEIRANSMVRRVLMRDTRAIGVEYEAHGAIGREEADRIVLSAGVVNSPHILMLSGIGPREQLQRVGVEPIVDLPVGQTFFDHAFVPLTGYASDTSEPRCGFRAEFKYTSDGGQRNDICVFPCLLEPASLNYEVPTDVNALVLVGIVLAKPRSSGWMNLVSNDPHRQPELHLNFLADPFDVHRMKDATRFMYDIATTPPAAREIKQLLLPTAEVVDDDERLVDWLRRNIATGYHGTSTCRMGPSGDPTAVVDHRAAVHGTEGLYVADASVMREITTGLTNLTCYMIGEKVAEMLRSEQPAVPALTTDNEGAAAL